MLSAVSLLNEHASKCCGLLKQAVHEALADKLLERKRELVQKEDFLLRAGFRLDVTTVESFTAQELEQKADPLHVAEDLPSAQRTVRLRDHLLARQGLHWPLPELQCSNLRKVLRLPAEVRRNPVAEKWQICTYTEADDQLRRAAEVLVCDVQHPCAPSTVFEAELDFLWSFACYAPQCELLYRECLEASGLETQRHMQKTFDECKEPCDRRLRLVQFWLVLQDLVGRDSQETLSQKVPPLACPEPESLDIPVELVMWLSERLKVPK